MALERYWERQGPILLTQNGSEDGLVTVSDVLYFKVKQKVVIASATQPDYLLEVKRVHSLTQLTVGPIKDKGVSTPKHNLKSKADISNYLIIDGATIRAAEQPKSVPTPEDIIKAVYEQEPTLAIRTFLVDKIGKGYDVDNPLPVSASFGDITVEIANPSAGQILNIPVATNLTETAIVLPNDTSKFSVEIRKSIDSFRIALTPGGTSGSAYKLIELGGSFESPILNVPDGYTIYVASERRNNVIFEVTTWKDPV